MIIDENHPDYRRAKVVDVNGDLWPDPVKAVDLTYNEYTRYERDARGRLTGELELVKAKKITWCWYTKTITIEEL